MPEDEASPEEDSAPPPVAEEYHPAEPDQSSLIFEYSVGDLQTPRFLQMLGFPPHVTILAARGSRSFPYEPFPDLLEIDGELIVLNQRLSGVATFWPHHYAAATIGVDAPLPAHWVCWLPGRAVVAVEFDAQQAILRVRAESDQNPVELAKCFSKKLPGAWALVSRAVNLLPTASEHLWTHIVIGFEPAPTLRCFDFGLLDADAQRERSIVRLANGQWTWFSIDYQVERDRCDASDPGAKERFEMPDGP